MRLAMRAAPDVCSESGPACVSGSARRPRVWVLEVEA